MHLAMESILVAHFLVLVFLVVSVINDLSFCLNVVNAIYTEVRVIEVNIGMFDRVFCEARFAQRPLGDGEGVAALRAECIHTADTGPGELHWAPAFAASLAALRLAAASLRFCP